MDQTVAIMSLSLFLCICLQNIKWLVTSNSLALETCLLCMLCWLIWAFCNHWLGTSSYYRLWLNVKAKFLDLCPYPGQGGVDDVRVVVVITFVLLIHASSCCRCYVQILPNRLESLVKQMLTLSCAWVLFSHKD